MPRVSVIMPMDRPGPDATQAIDAVLSQSFHALELLVVGAVAPTNSDARIRFIPHVERNPAERRNAAAKQAKGEFLAFIDDDAFAHPDWLKNALAIFSARPEIVAIGGPDPGPQNVPSSELISDLLLATPMIGSGIACHESREFEFEVRSPHDLALVNLLVRRASFEIVGGFDPSIGYIGEDTDLIRRLMVIGRVLYSPDVVVQHRRRGFPRAFIAQRWRYRVKTGELLVRGGEAGESYRGNKKLLAFLVAAMLALVTMIAAPALFLLLLMAYIVATFLLSAPKNRLPMLYTPLIPLFFAVHHATYLLGILWGAGKALSDR